MGNKNESKKGIDELREDLPILNVDEMDKTTGSGSNFNISWNTVLDEPTPQ